MTRLLYGPAGEARYHLSGPAVLYDRHNRPLGRVVEGQLLGVDGRALGWFDGLALRDPQGALWATTAEARGRLGLDLPEPAPAGFRPRAQRVHMRPLAAPRVRPRPQDRWSERTLEALLSENA